MAALATQELFNPSLAARASARLHRRTLDQELAAGANPAECEQWAARAAELTRRSSRERAAEEVEQLIRFADEPHRFRVGPHPVAARVNRAELQRLADRLREDSPLYVRGLAALALALTDGTGPIYTDRDGHALARELESLNTALLS